MSEKVAWQGKLIGIQPRIRLMRSFDETPHLPRIRATTPGYGWR